MFRACDSSRSIPVVRKKFLKDCTVGFHLRYCALLERRAVAADDTNPAPVRTEARPVCRARRGVLDAARRVKEKEDHDEEEFSSAESPATDDVVSGE
jgi:hypothetical protein